MKQKKQKENELCIVCNKNERMQGAAWCEECQEKIEKENKAKKQYDADQIEKGNINGTSKYILVRMCSYCLWINQPTSSACTNCGHFFTGEATEKEKQEAFKNQNKALVRCKK